jgi:hypothetical protein
MTHVTGLSITLQDCNSLLYVLPTYPPPPALYMTYAGLSGEPTHEQVANMLALVTSLYSVATNLTASNGPRLQLSSGIHTTAAQVT